MTDLLHYTKPYLIQAFMEETIFYHGIVGLSYSTKTFSAVLTVK